MEFTALEIAGTPPSKRAFHTCSSVQGFLYVFGGITDDRSVLNDMHRFDPSNNSWLKLECGLPRITPSRPAISHQFPRGKLCGPPSLSHHTATTIRDRYIVIIGGWNGRKRTAEVFCYDTVEQIWRQISVSGDVPVGLSSHTACLVSTKSILIIGREGGVHMQRRFSGAFMLDFETGKYREAPFHAASRSGHTANLVYIRGSKKHYVFVFGGRKSGGYELMSTWDKFESSQYEVTQDKLNKVLLQCGGCVTEPCGRQHAQSIEIGSRYLLIYGGETWTGVRENVTNDLYILDSLAMHWFKVPSGQAPKLVGHTMCAVNNRLLVFAGKLENRCDNTIWEVKVG
ncbi:predicted protein [Nematostella vectensis]|uniref:Kelch domain-containing protein 9 n=1 Tax=Nematostella vectensis TaxID=45351 RepID=A7RKQ9_NEMVE|nr:kelch domain-containing protein 9 [Nematostella vectensis]EDO48031.1 predicted protein [Nematostella vectensis]|eukprot:XP_001640094.1 predicted protein [Nematostella vectensis]